jgi:hypothetical protein
MGKRSHDLPWFRSFATKLTPDGLDQIGWQMREITDGLMLDLAVLAKGAPQQMGLVDASLIDACGRGYMNSTRSSCHAEKIAVNCMAVKTRLILLVAVKCILLKHETLCTEGLYANNRLKIRG